MISDIRKFKNSAAYKTTLWIVAVSLLAGSGLLSISSLFKEQFGQWALRVNGYTISKEEFISEAIQKHRWLSRIRSQYGAYTDYVLQSVGLSSNPESLALHVLMKEALMYQVVLASKLHLDADYIASQLQNPMVIMQDLGSVVPPQALDLKAGGINAELLKKALQENHMKVSTFEQRVYRILANKLVEDLITQSEYIPEFMLRSRYIADMLRKQFSVVTLSLDSFIEAEKDANNISDDEIREYIDMQNKRSRKYYVPEKRSGRTWRFNSNSFGTLVSEDDIERYYQDHKIKEFINEPAKVEVRRILIAVKDVDTIDAMRAQAEEIRRSVIANPASFAQVAQEISNDESAINGGLLEPFTRNTHSKQFERAAFNLKNDGDISDVIATENGFEIIQRVSRISQTYKPLEQVYDSIATKLRDAAFKTEFAEKMRCTVEQECSSEESFDAFALSKGISSEEVGPITQEATPLSQALFSINAGEITFFAEGNEGIVVRLTDVQEGYFPSFDTIKSVALEDMRHERAKVALKDAIDNAVRASKEGTSLEAIASEHDASYTTVPWIGKNDKDQISELISKSLPAQVMMQMNKVGLVIVHTTDEHGYLIRLDEIEPFDEANFEAEKSNIMASLNQEQLPLYKEAVIDYLYRNAKLETDSSLFGHEAEEELQYER